MKHFLKLAFCLLGVAAPFAPPALSAEEPEEAKTEYLFQVGEPSESVSSVYRYKLTRVDKRPANDGTLIGAMTGRLAPKLVPHLALAAANMEAWKETMKADPFPSDLGSYTRLDMDTGSSANTYYIYYDPVLDFGPAVDLKNHTADKACIVIKKLKPDDGDEGGEEAEEPPAPSAPEYVTDSEFFGKVNIYDSNFSGTFYFRIKGDEDGFYKVTERKEIKYEAPKDPDPEASDSSDGGEGSEGGDELAQVVSSDAVVGTSEAGDGGMRPSRLAWSNEKFTPVYFVDGSKKTPALSVGNHPEDIYFSPRYNYGLWQADECQKLEYYDWQDFSLTAPAYPGGNVVYTWEYIVGEDWVDWGWGNIRTLSFRLRRDGDDKLGIRCKIDGGDGSVEYKYYFLQVAYTPRINGNVVVEGAMEGDTLKFSVSASGTDLKYRWQYYDAASKSWLNLADHPKYKEIVGEEANGSGADKAACSIKNADESLAGLKVRCLVSSYDSFNEYITSSAATVKLVAAPSITRDPADVYVQFGKTAKFTVSAKGTKLQYQWKKRGEIIDADGNPDDDANYKWENLEGATKNSYTTPKIESEVWDGMVVRCEVRSEGSTIVRTSGSATLNLSGISPDVAVFENEEASFWFFPAAGETFAGWERKLPGEKNWTAYRNPDTENPSALTVIGGDEPEESGAEQGEGGDGGEDDLPEIKLDYFPDGTLFRAVYEKAGKTLYSKQVKLSVATTAIVMTGNLPQFARDGLGSKGVYGAFLKEKLSLKVQATGVAPFTYQWQYVNGTLKKKDKPAAKDGDPVVQEWVVEPSSSSPKWTDIKGATKNTYAINSLASGDMGGSTSSGRLYRCVVTGKAGVMESETYAVTQRVFAAAAEAKLDNEPPDGREYFAAGEEAELKAAVTGDPDIYVRWEIKMPKSSKWTKYTSDTLFVPEKKPDDSGSAGGSEGSDGSESGNGDEEPPDTSDYARLKVVAAESLAGAAFRLVAYNEGNKKTPSEGKSISIPMVGSPAVTLDPSNSTEYEIPDDGYATATFTVTAANANSYRWQISYYDGKKWSAFEDLEGATEATLRLGNGGTDSEGNALIPFEGTYKNGISKYKVQCVVSNNYGADTVYAVTSKPASGTVYQYPKINAISYAFAGAEPVEVKESGELHYGFEGFAPKLEVLAEGYSLVYQWYSSGDPVGENLKPVNWTAVIGARTKTFTPKDKPKAGESVSYKCVVSNKQVPFISDSFYFSLGTEKPWMPENLFGGNLEIVGVYDYKSDPSLAANDRRMRESVIVGALDKSKSFTEYLCSVYQLKPNGDGDPVVDESVEPFVFGQIYDPSTYSFKRLGPTAADFKLTGTNVDSKEKLNWAGKLNMRLDRDLGLVFCDFVDTKTKQAYSVIYSENSVDAADLAGKVLDWGLDGGEVPVGGLNIPDTVSFTSAKDAQCTVDGELVAAKYTYSRNGSYGSLKLTVGKSVYECKLRFMEEEVPGVLEGYVRVNGKNAFNQNVYEYRSFSLSE